MSRLIQILAFTNVASGATATVAHSLNSALTPILPDFAVPDTAGFVIVTITTTNVTVRNDNPSTASCNVLVERWHSIPREIGGVAALSPQPFVPALTASAAAITTPYNLPGAEPAQIRYIRTTGGSDSNNGLTPATAWLTITKGLEWFSLASINQAQVLDVTGCTFTGSYQLDIGTVNLGNHNNTFDLTGTGPDNFISNSIKQIRSELTTNVPAVTITGAVADATSGLYTNVTVTNVFVANEHRGRFLVGSGLIEWAVIQGNGVNSLSITSTTDPQTWTGPIGIYSPGATFTFGNPVDIDDATTLSAFSDFFITGCAFTSTADSKAGSFRVMDGHSNIYLQLCDIRGLVLDETTAYVALDACYVHDRLLSLDGCSYIFRNCYFREVDNLHHAAGAFSDFTQCYSDGATAPFGGSPYNTTWASTINLANCNFMGGTGTGGVRFVSGLGRMSNCVVSNNASPGGIIVGQGAQATLTNVDGTGNTGHGIVLYDGALVRAIGGTSVTGTVGDILLGGAGTIAYAAVPTDDLAAAAGTRQLVRITNAAVPSGG